jgi:catechol 2,3-dioxygenase-like lactoylglutathione lyase family enzyme
MQLLRLDHLVLTVSDLAATVDFYTRVLGMKHEIFGAGRHALKFGDQKLNLHPAAQPLLPHARLPQPGSADLCFLTAMPIAEVVADLRRAGVTIEVGPVPRTGATGELLSVYVRDPDGNLIEIANAT